MSEMFGIILLSSNNRYSAALGEVYPELVCSAYDRSQIGVPTLCGPPLGDDIKICIYECLAISQVDKLKHVLGRVGGV